MNLQLTALPDTLTHYTGKPVPEWARMLHPDAAYSILEIEDESGGLVYTDMWRSAAVSRWARQHKSGVQPAGYSAHNYGLAIDFAVDATLKRRGWLYTDLLEFLERHNWFCHRRDARRGGEDWHFNYLGDDPSIYLSRVVETSAATWSKPAEERIQAIYGKSFQLTLQEEQQALKELKFYAGPIDGIKGPGSRRAEAQFRETWYLPSSGQPEKYLRTLAFVTAKKTML